MGWMASLLFRYALGDRDIACEHHGVETCTSEPLWYSTTKTASASTISGIGCHQVGGTMNPHRPAIAPRNARDTSPAASSASVGVPVAGSAVGASRPGSMSSAGFDCCPNGQMIQPFSYGGPPGTKNLVGKCHPMMRSAVIPILSSIVLSFH